MQSPTDRICGPEEVPPTGVVLIEACHQGTGGRLLASG